MVVRSNVEMSLHTFLAAWRQVSRGDPHIIFAGGSRYIPPAAIGQVNREAFEELTELGLTTGRELSHALVDTLEVLDNAATEFYAHIRTGDEQYGVLVAAGVERSGVTALAQDGRVWLKPAPRSASTAAILVRHLPEFPSAEFTPFSVPQHEIADDYARSEELRWFQEIFAEPYYGLGELHTIRNGERNSDQLTYLDADSGRIGFELTGPPNNRYVNVFPGDHLAAKLANLR